MTSVAASGTYTKSSGGFNALKANERKRSLFFYGSSVGDSCKLQLEGGGDIEGGDIVELPTSIDLTINADLQIVLTGTPDLTIKIVTS